MVGEKKSSNKKIFIVGILGLLLLILGVVFTSLLPNDKTGNTLKDPDSHEDDNSSDKNDKNDEDVIITYESIKNPNIKAVYEYNESSCVTGEESTCKLLYEFASPVKPGTIIKYNVDGVNEYYFFVISDNGDTLTMQQRENTIHHTPWYAIGDDPEGYDATKGPLTVLPVLEETTKNWVNVNDQTYAMGTTKFVNNAYTGCDDGTYKCMSNAYTLSERTVKARMITVQEINTLKNKNADRRYPIWMTNYLSGSTVYGGTIDVYDSEYYWTMNSDSGSSDCCSLAVHYSDVVYSARTNLSSVTGARAVVVVNK